MKTAFLNIVAHNLGAEEHSIGTIRANKDGRRAVVEWVGIGETVCFPSVAKAWDYVKGAVDDNAYFEPTAAYPEKWRKNFI